MMRNEMDNAIAKKLTYGLFVLTAREGDKDNGCIIDTAIQVADNPAQISISVEKTCYTHNMIMNTGEFTVSIISESADLELFQLFGYQSGEDVNKFADFTACRRGSNGIYYITKGTNAYISVKVTKKEDLNSHTLFIGEIIESEELNEEPSATYDFYAKNIKFKSTDEKACSNENPLACSQKEGSVNMEEK